MQITLDVKCFKTSEDGKILTAQLTENAILVIAPEKQRPTKHEGWIVISKDLSPAIIGQWVHRTQQEAEVARVNACYPTAYIVIPIYWET